MKIHSKARTTVFQRARIVEKVRDGSWTIRAAAGGVGRTIRKWLATLKAEVFPVIGNKPVDTIYVAQNQLPFH